MGQRYSRNRPGVALGAFLLLAVAGCASSHIVRPLGKGNGNLNVSLGGPFVAFGDVTVPTPIASIGGAYGVRDDLEVFGHLDVTALAFGIVHVDPGIAMHPIVREKGWIPTVTVGAALHLLTNFQDFRGVPQLTVAAAWRIARRHMIYVGGDLGFGFEPQGFRAIWGPFVGGEARLGKRLGLSLELKWIEPEYNVLPLAPAWVGIANQGYLSILLGINVYLGDVK
jgi:hypothetical protein